MQVTLTGGQEKTQGKEIMEANSRGQKFRHIRAGDLSKHEVVTSGFGAHPTSEVP